MSGTPEISFIRQAISTLQERARHLQDTAKSGYAHDAAYRVSQVADRADIEMRKLEAKWSAFILFERQAEKSYDAYVCNPVQECTCHISPPCNFCIEKSGKENEEEGAA